MHTIFDLQGWVISNNTLMDSPPKKLQSPKSMFSGITFSDQARNAGNFFLHVSTFLADGACEAESFLGQNFELGSVP